MERRDDKEDRELKKGKGENKKKKEYALQRKKKREHPQTSSHTAEQKNVALLR